MNGSTHAGCAHLDAMRRFPEPTMFFQGGISMRFQLGFELCIEHISFPGWTAWNRFREQFACFSSLFEVPLDGGSGNSKQMDYFGSESAFINRT